LTLAGIYISSLLIGSVIAGLTAKIFMRHRKPSILAMELPAYRAPRWIPILRMTWARGSAYLKRAGVPILIVSAVLWFLSNFGYVPTTFIAQAEMQDSFAGQLGAKIEPVLRPMGVDWRVGVGLISAFAAREVFVSATTTVFVFNTDEEPTEMEPFLTQIVSAFKSFITAFYAPEADDTEGLLDKMRTATFAGTSQRIFTNASIIGLIVFFFFSLQCFSTVAVVRKEMDSWKLASLQLLFYTGLGYALAVITVQTLRTFGVA
jgi:ferrous iron transport protein B